MENELEDIEMNSFCKLAADLSNLLTKFTQHKLALANVKVISSYGSVQ